MFFVVGIIRDWVGQLEESGEYWMGPKPRNHRGDFEAQITKP
jgi:hypothetical protein